MSFLQKLTLFVFLIVNSSTSNAQRFDYGVTFIFNSSAQTNTDPTKPEDGTFQWNALGTLGVGAYALKEITQRFATSLHLNYQVKGYKEIAQVRYVPGGPTYEESLKNTFNYLCGDIFIKYKITNSPSLQFWINMGAEYGYLLNYEIQSDFVPINFFYPVNEYQDRWEKHNLSLIPSLSLTFAQATTFEFGFNGSITPVLKTDNLIVKDWIWTIRISQSIPDIFKKKKLITS